MVAVEVLCIPGVDDEYRGDSQGYRKGSTIPCALIKFIGDPGTDFKVPTTFLT